MGANKDARRLHNQTESRIAQRKVAQNAAVYIIEVDDYEPKPIAACTSEAEANNIVEQLHNEGVGSFRVSGYPAIPLNPNGIDLANAIRAKWDEY